MTCETIRILIKNQLLDATITGSETQADKNIVNITDTWRSRFARFKKTKNQSIYFNRDAPEIADSFFIKLDGELVTMRLILYKDENQTGEKVYDSGIKYASYLIPLGTWRVGMDAYGATVNNADDALVHYFDSVIYRSGEIIINDKNADKNLDIYFVTLGQSFSPERNINYGASLTANFNSIDRRTRGGSLISVGNKSRWRELSASFSDATTADRIRLWNEIQETGGKGVFVNPYPNNKNSAFEQQNAFIANAVISGFNHVETDGHSLDISFIGV